MFRKKNVAFLSLEIVFVLANNVGPDKMLQYVDISSRYSLFVGVTLLDKELTCTQL